jgi:hypothetical protein
MRCTLVYSSKALAQEVRILLQEVGKLRDERRQLQFEVAELLAVKVNSPIDWRRIASDTYTFSIESAWSWWQFLSRMVSNSLFLECLTDTRIPQGSSCEFNTVAYL